MARLFDYGFALLLAHLTFLLFSFTPSLMQMGLLLILIPLLWAPFEIFFLRNFGKTPGKALFGITVLSESKNPLTLSQAWIRSLLSSVNALLFFIPGINLWLAWRSYKEYKELGTLWIDRASHCSVQEKPYGKLRKSIGMLLAMALPVIPIVYPQVMSQKALEISLSFFQNNTWTEFKSEKFNFSIAFPKKPDHEKKTLSIPSSKTKLEYEEAKCTVGETSEEVYSVTYTVLPQSWFKWPSNWILKGALDAITAFTKQGEIKDRTSGLHQKFPALDYFLDDHQAKETRGRLILIGNCLFKIEVCYSKSHQNKEALQEALNAFISSFTLNT